MTACFISIHSRDQPRGAAAILAVFGERRLEDLLLLAHAPELDAELEHYQVFGPGLRIAIVGPAPAAKASCEFIAGDMVKRGVRSAACIYPKAS